MAIAGGIAHLRLVRWRQGMHIGAMGQRVGFIPEEAECQVGDGDAAEEESQGEDL